MPHSNGRILRQGLKLTLGTAVSLAALALLVIRSGPGASADLAQAPTPAHWWQADGNANDTPGPGVSPDNGTLEGAGFAPGPSSTEQAFSFAGGGQQIVFNKVGGNSNTEAFTFAFDIKTTATEDQAVWESA